MKAFDFTVRTKQDLIEAVQTFGFVPLFAGSVPGFSVEEHAAPEVWYSKDSDDWKVWEWKGPVIRECGCAYGKFFEKKAVFISGEWFQDFANYRRDGYDFDARWDDGLAYRGDKILYELLDAHAPVLSKSLKTIGNYRKGGNTGFDKENSHIVEFNLKLDSNPEFTGSVIAAYARAAYKLNQEGTAGAKTIFDIPVGYLSNMTSAELRKKLL